MREGNFIKRNLDRWKSYQEDTPNPDELAQRFINLVDDLGYAKTFYPKSNTVKYINTLAANIYLSIYRNKKEDKNRIISFWTTELPLVIQRNHIMLLIGFLFFVSFLLIGIFSANIDQNFIRAILGDGYVDMTERNIAEGDPFGVYKSQSEWMMFVQIAYNNIWVTFLLFSTGIFFGVGTLYFILKNSLMLGVFETFFFRHNLGIQSILVIFIHGTLEISALVIAGGAGLMLGNALLFPKTYSRIVSLKKGAKDSIKIIIGLIPIFIVAAFFEGFITRHTEMPIWISCLILIASLSFIVFYFIFYPIKMGNKYKEKDAVV